MVNALEAMEKHSWPNGVTSWNDTVKFAQLVFGTNVPMENYWHRLPHASSKSFLLFARGACGPNTPLSQVADWIEPHFRDIAQKEVELGNHNNPLKSQADAGQRQCGDALFFCTAHACSLHMSDRLWG